jgi:hypothetical protein
MTKKEINKRIIKEFIQTVNNRYKVMSDFEDTEGGRMSFSLDMDGNEMYFEFHRSYLDVYSYLIKGEKLYDKGFNMECELQETLHFVKNQVLNNN